jgi:DMSO/TMAO reductase YedYZ heme-binding membrane subunit
MSQQHSITEKKNIQFRASVSSVAKTNNMKQIIIKAIFLLCASAPLRLLAQENMHPAPAQAGTIALINATIHVGNGQARSFSAMERSQRSVLQAQLLPTK